MKLNIKLTNAILRKIEKQDSLFTTLIELTEEEGLILNEDTMNSLFYLFNRIVEFC